MVCRKTEGQINMVLQEDDRLRWITIMALPFIARKNQEELVQFPFITEIGVRQPLIFLSILLLTAKNL